MAVLAELAARYSLSDTRLVLECGWYDSSGMDGSSVRPWAARHPRSKQWSQSEGVPWEKRARQFGRLWAIAADEWGEAVVTLDLPSGEVADRDGKVNWSIVEEYKNGAGIREMAWRMEQDFRR